MLGVKNVRLPDLTLFIPAMTLGGHERSFHFIGRETEAQCGPGLLKVT